MGAEKATPGARAGSGGAPGVLLAAVTALVSGVSVFVNSYGVHAIASPAAYTTAKNLVATAVLALMTFLAPVLRATPAAAVAKGWTATRAADDAGAPAGSRHSAVAHWLAVAYVGIVGGGVAFILFFDGLARTTATPAAFLHDSLVVWVALLAWPALREHLSGWNVLAITLLVVGQIAVLGGVGHLAVNPGDALVLAATILWSVEVLVAKRLLARLGPATLSLVRMGGGSVVLLAYLAAAGTLHTLFSLGIGQLGWVALTGLLLAAYVGTWMGALSLARALDVTSVLVASTVVTALLQGASGAARIAPEIPGLALIALGMALAVHASHRKAAA